MTASCQLYEALSVARAASGVFVVTDMICAVAVITGALAAVAEIHFGICLVRDAAHFTFVKILNYYVKLAGQFLIKDGNLGK